VISRVQSTVHKWRSWLAMKNPDGACLKAYVFPKSSFRDQYSLHGLRAENCFRHGPRRLIWRPYGRILAPACLGSHFIPLWAVVAILFPAIALYDSHCCARRPTLPVNDLNRSLVLTSSLVSKAITPICLNEARL